MNKEKVVEIINNSEILKRLSDERVCAFKDSLNSEVTVGEAFIDNELLLREQCDGWFRELLSKDDIIELSKVFSEIADQM